MAHPGPETEPPWFGQKGSGQVEGDKDFRLLPELRQRPGCDDVKHSALPVQAHRFGAQFVCSPGPAQDDLTRDGAGGWPFVYIQSAHVPVWIILNPGSGQWQSSSWLKLTKDMEKKCHG
jgi:hypothetical protein